MVNVLLAGALGLMGAAGVWWFARAGGPYRAGPWPGLTPRGAGLLLAHALLLAAGQILVGPPQNLLPDLPIQAVLALAPLALATRLVHAPGAASAVCGAFLLPRSIATLLDPTLGLPPPLLAPAFAFDILAWIRSSDLADLRHALPGQRNVWRRRNRDPRRLRRGRIAAAGAVFGAILVILQASPSVEMALAGSIAAVLCTLVAVSVTGTGAPPKGAPRA
jgi:hypothetical protein